MNAKTLEAITRHGETLLRAFPNATEKNPVALCKKLRRIETAVARPILDNCNGDNGVTVEQLDAICHKALARVEKLLFADGVISGEPANRICGLFVNRDPRGHALKLDDAWSRNFNDNQYMHKLPALHTDMGGYGIIAPNLTIENKGE